MCELCVCGSRGVFVCVCTHTGTQIPSYSEGRDPSGSHRSVQHWLSSSIPGMPPQWSPEGHPGDPFSGTGHDYQFSVEIDCQLVDSLIPSNLLFSSEHVDIYFVSLCV